MNLKRLNQYYGYVWVEKLCNKIGCEYFCSNGLIENNRVAKLTHILKKEVNAHMKNAQIIIIS